jgi:hypothetical protein
VITYKLVENFCRDIGLEYVELNFMPKKKKLSPEETENNKIHTTRFLVTLITNF